MYGCFFMAVKSLPNIGRAESGGLRPWGRSAEVDAVQHFGGRPRRLVETTGQGMEELFGPLGRPVRGQMLGRQMRVLTHQAEPLGVQQQLPGRRVAGAGQRGRRGC